mmetsp:Transcript_26249/g.42510  ORF Transcript_26249/g.42510 Transcript_26249/m.42510 type:complete len:181 (+) Transcript_26249:404-946(+)
MNDLTDFMILQEQAIKQGSEGMMANIPGYKKVMKIEEIEQQLTFFKALKERELLDDKWIGEREIKRVVQQSDLDRKEVESLLHSFTTSKYMHKWLRIREKEGLKRPETAAEMNDFMLFDRRGFPQNRPKWQMDMYILEKEKLEWKKAGKKYKLKGWTNMSKHQRKMRAKPRYVKTFGKKK